MFQTNYTVSIPCPDNGGRWGGGGGTGDGELGGVCGQLGEE